jgi:DNA-binding transcriptional ArsR family regulator
MRSVILPAAILMALLAAPPALAAMGSGTLSAELPLQAIGSSTLMADDAAILVEGDLGALQFTAAAQEGAIIRVVQRAFGYVHPDDPRLELTWHAQEERIRRDLAGASLTLTGTGKDFVLLVHGAAGHLASAQPLYMGALSQGKTLESEWAGQVGVQVHSETSPNYRYHLEPAQLQSRIRSGQAGADGAFEAYISDAELLYTPRGGAPELFRASFREEQRPGAVFNPVAGRWFGPGEHTEYVQEYLVLEIAQGQFRLVSDQAPVFLYADEAVLHLTGEAILPAARGALKVQADGKETLHPFGGEELRLSGQFTLAASGTQGGRTQLIAQGDFTQVSYGAVRAEYAWATPLVVAGIGTLVLAGAAWLLSQGKVLAPLGGGMVAAYARVSGNEVLTHDARQEVYERVKSQPGVSFHELNDQVEFGASTLNYHLRVLERNGFVTRLKDGRYVRFFDRQSGAYAGGRKVALSALKNQTTAAIAREILRRPGVAQCDLASRFDIAASTVNWHVKRLQDAGLVEKQRDHHFTRYYGGPAWSQMPDADQARWLAA